MSLSARTLWIIAIMHASCLSLITVPFLCYHLYNFSKRRNEMFILKRYPQLVIIGNILMIILFISYLHLNSIKMLSPIQHTNPQGFNIVGRSFNVTANLLNGAIQSTYICRFWLMCYDLNHANSNMNKQWKSYLDPTLIQKDFWLKHKTSFGSLSYCFIICNCIFTVLFSIIPIVYCQI
eukprot:39371_1